MKKMLLKNYAKLIVSQGLSLRKGQSVIIQVSVENEEFASLVVKECYKAGAGRVVVRWISETVNKIAYLNCKEKYLTEVYPEELAYMKWSSEDLPATLYLTSADPDALVGVDPMLLAKIRMNRYRVMKEYIEASENKHQWCIAGVAGKKWAKKMFPELSTAKAVEKLWEAILYSSRALDGNGIKNWEEHNANLKKKIAYLNSLNLKELHYYSSNGTNLRVGLIPGVNWQAGGETDLKGDFFQPNIPSEECFTTPRRGDADGVVYSAKPLVYNGNIIENFHFVFKEGKVVEVHAEKGEEVLKSILSLDEGASYLGECALVPFDSPINNTGLLFFSTLYDENAACHLAIGRGFPELLPGFEKLSEEEIFKAGINRSQSHVDFMIGSKDLNIVGINDKGEEIHLFSNGNWDPEILAKLG